jgi:hypothetical protein
MYLRTNKETAMGVTVELNLDRKEYDVLAGIFKINGKRVAPTLLDCLRKEAAALKDQANDLIGASDADSVRTDVQTEPKISQKKAGQS